MKTKEKVAVDLIEASMLLSVSVSTLRRWIAKGYMRGFQTHPKGKWFMNIEDVNVHRGLEVLHD